MSREPIATHFFALAVVRLGHRFLLVHERRHGQGWYLPAGRVEPGERVTDAAVRETLEEAGVPIVLEGILRIEGTPALAAAGRVRVFFVARPRDDTPPKRTADAESLEAAWVSLDELTRYPLRDPEVRQVLEHVNRGGAVYPMSLLTGPGAPWR